MSRSHKVLGFLLVVALGAVGCARTPEAAGGDPAAATRAKVQRLEEDYKAAAAARDQFRAKVIAAEEQQAKLRQQLDRERAAAEQGREALQAQLNTRTAERDTLQAQYGGFLRTIKEQIDRAETALHGAPAGPTVPVGGAVVPTLAGPPVAELRN